MNYDKRKNIELWRRDGLNKTTIAKLLHVSRNTINKEIKRGTLTTLRSDLSKVSKYEADYAQLIHDEAVKTRGTGIKITTKIRDYIRQKVIPPEVICHLFLRTNVTT